MDIEAFLYIFGFLIKKECTSWNQRFKNNKMRSGIKLCWVDSFQKITKFGQVYLGFKSKEQGRREKSKAPGQRRKMRPPASEESRIFSGSKNKLWNITACVLHQPPRP